MARLHLASNARATADTYGRAKYTGHKTPQ